ncbi:Error-prone repair protein ImuA [Niabella sp. CC-SYL272]|uniref:ImuA family protein n=1 Tax=Niabella agricola TaxID=2891571 RepID=UPI001F4707BF|nr:Error-prone repair protein ImuA [Niabella agricola]MCF3109558.1 Error-prone repair protein ImuA [Niabella agricola]
MLLIVTNVIFLVKMVTKPDILAQLQKEILDMQGLRVPLESERRDTGLGIINQAFPNQTFPVSAVHEFLSHSKDEAAATTGFISGLLGTLMCKGSCLWISRQRTVFPVALKAFGVRPDQVIFVQATNTKDALWIIEEGLKCGSLAAVISEIPELTFTESRRLQLAVEKSHVTGFIHRNVKGPAGNVACVSRWSIRPLPSMETGIPGVGIPAWNVELSKIRNGKPGQWQVYWTETGFEIATKKAPALPIAIKKVS